MAEDFWIKTRNKKDIIDNDDYDNKTNHWTARYKLAITNVIVNLFKISSSKVSGKMIYCSVSVTWIWIYDDYLLHEITNSIKIVLSRKRPGFLLSLLFSDNSFPFLQIQMFTFFVLTLFKSNWHPESPKKGQISPISREKVLIYEAMNIKNFGGHVTSFFAKTNVFKANAIPRPSLAIPLGTCWKP